MKSIANGVWPTMITPYNKDLSIDYGAMEVIAQWYLKEGSAGIFAVCLSSEMFHLSVDESEKAAKTVVKAAGNVPIIASGHISENLDVQIDGIKRMAQTGVSAVVMVTNRLADETDSDEVWKKNLEYVINRIPSSIDLGFYECPYPYKKVLSTELLKWCADTDRFAFYKDTCCDIDLIQERLNALKGTGFKLFNANGATLYDSLKVGASGYSGVMANVHPGLYALLCENWDNDSFNAELLSNYLGLASVVESRNYPICAKYAMQELSLPIKTYSRKDSNDLPKSFKQEVKQMLYMDNIIREMLNI